MSAALAFYALLALAPLTVFALFVTGQMFGNVTARTELFKAVERNLGVEAARTIESLLSAVKEATLSTWTGALVLGVSIWAASGLFGVITDSLNAIWRYRPNYGGLVRSFVVDRLISAMAALLFVAILAVWMGFDAVRGYISIATGGIGRGPLASFLVTLGFLTLGLGIVYKTLPHRHADWREVWFGALVAALGISLLKFALGLYLSYSRVEDVYRSAGAIIVILLWVFYSAQAFFYGAEIVHESARPRRSPQGWMELPPLASFDNDFTVESKRIELPPEA